MRRLSYVLAIAAVVASSGCLVVSTSSLSTDRDAVFEPALVGTWNDSPTEHWVVSRLGESAYKVVADDGKTRTKE
jgi:hypothetical protein